MAGALLGSILAFSKLGAGCLLVCLMEWPECLRIVALDLLLAAALFSEVEKRARPTAITGEVVVVASEPGAWARKPSFVAASILNAFSFPHGRPWLVATLSFGRVRDMVYAHETAFRVTSSRRICFALEGDRCCRSSLTG